jgi:hypothetical protein
MVTDNGGTAHLYMTLLDWFAGKALGQWCITPNAAKYRDMSSDDEIAEDCYKLAEAMIKRKRILEETPTQDSSRYSTTVLGAGD